MQEHPSLTNAPSDKKNDLSLNLREQLEVYIINWKWFLLGVFISLIIALLYLRYTVPQYKATATILVRDDRKGTMATEMTAFADLGLTTGIKNNVDNEIEVVKSRTIVERSIKKLGFNVRYFVEGRVKKIELYKDKPIDVAFFDMKDSFYAKPRMFLINAVSDQKFELKKPNGKSLGQFTYGNIIDMGNFKIIVSHTTLKAFKKFDKFSIIVSVGRLNDVVRSYKSRLTIAALSKNSSVVELSLSDPVMEKAEDLLNTMIKIYNEDAISDKNFISQNTVDFVGKRLEIISKELGDVEKDAAGFKQMNRLTDITSDVGVFLQNSVDFEKALIETETQIRVVDAMIDFINSGKTELIPNNIIPDDATSAALITEHNNEVLREARISKGATDRNSVLIISKARIEELRDNIRESLSRLMATLKIRRSDLEKQVNLVTGKISKIPGQTREFHIIDRQQKIKEALYIYLLQKREEVAISLAVTAPNAKVIDPALSSSTPVYPKPNVIFLGAIVIGLLIPFVIIYLINLLDSKVKNRQDVENRVKAPFLGDIPKSMSNAEIINANSRSSAAEAIRIIRTNLEFMLANVRAGESRVIFITSTLPKEGKTFVAVNLAATIALSKKKVLLIGMDVRNPKLDQYLKLPQKGLTNYLSQAAAPVAEYIVKMDMAENFYVLPSGVVPPNPVELLMSDKINLMFAELRQEFDYIIVDTAPVSVVTDTLLVAQNADSFIYVVRAHYLDKRLLTIPQNFYSEKKLPNMAVLLNDTDLNKGYGYGGYGYGYHQEEEKKPWYKWFSKKI